MNSAMTLRDVSAFYDGKPAIAHISADIPRNEITAVIGPSGCGKSTLLRCMNGLLAQEPGTEVRGEIALDGTVESCEYYGLYIKYYIHVGTQSLKVIEKNDGVNIYDPGQRVKVILNPNDIMAYAPSAEEVE